MIAPTRYIVTLFCMSVFIPLHSTRGGTAVIIDSPMSPPAWALLERELLKSNADACREFYPRYFDSRGFLQCVERWGGDDGPDDAIENCNDWNLLHALGADEDVLKMFLHAWEGHVRQFTLAKTVDVPFARDGMYYKEFPVMFDWVHNGEGINGFNIQSLCTPSDRKYQKRVKRFAGFYLNEDAGAQNYDPKHKIIRSMFNGSRGPLLRKATALDWAGDPIEVENRFELGHGEENYAQMLEHFEDYNDIIGDHPQNLCATSLALNAYVLDGDEKYKKWILEYVDAWLQRTKQNGGIIPTNIGLDGMIGGATDGKWYGGVYGWAFSVKVPQSDETAHRNTHQLGLDGFGNAFLLTGNQEYIDVWRTMIDTVNSHKRTVDGVDMYPRMHGDQGWYSFSPSPYAHGNLRIYYWTMKESDQKRVGQSGWLQFLQGKLPDYPRQALQSDLATIRQKVKGMRADPTTPDSRLADDPMKYNPATVNSLVNLMLGGIHPGRHGGPLHCRVRYFDPVKRRSGIPEDVAALVTRLTDRQTEVALVNVNQIESRDLIVQMGAYAEHTCEELEVDGQVFSVNDSIFQIRLMPGCGAKLQIKNRRYINQPTARFPWDRVFN